MCCAYCSFWQYLLLDTPTKCVLTLVGKKTVRQFQERLPISNSVAVSHLSICRSNKLSLIIPIIHIGIWSSPTGLSLYPNPLISTLVYHIYKSIKGWSHPKVTFLVISLFLSIFLKLTIIKFMNTVLSASIYLCVYNSDHSIW